MTQNSKPQLCLHPDGVVTQVNLCSVKLNQALSATAEVVKVGVPLLEGKAMKPRLSISLGKQIWVVRYTAVIVKVVTRLL